MSLFKNRTAIGVICIIISLCICFLITPLFNRGISKKTEIVRVSKEITEGDVITKDMVQVIEVGSYNLPNNVIKEKNEIIGKYALAKLSVGDYILSTKISEQPSTENSYLYNLDGSKQAISISIKNFATGLSGKLQSGDIVSVIAPDYKKQGITVIPPELKFVEVISVTTAKGEDANTGETKDNSEQKELPSTVTLLVTQQQSKTLAELEAEGNIHLSLVYRGIQKNSQKFVDIQLGILNELYPVEKVIQNKEIDQVIEKEKIEAKTNTTQNYKNGKQELSTEEE